MSVIASLLIMAGVVIVFVLLFCIPALVSMFKPELNRSQRKDLREKTLLINRIEAIAVQNQDIEPLSTAAIINEIRDQKMKELSS